MTKDRIVERTDLTIRAIPFSRLAGTRGIDAKWLLAVADLLIKDPGVSKLNAYNVNVSPYVYFATQVCVFMRVFFCLCVYAYVCACVCVRVRVRGCM